MRTSFRMPVFMEELRRWAPWAGQKLSLPSAPLIILSTGQMSVFLYILAARASCTAQRQGFEKKGPV